MNHTTNFLQVNGWKVLLTGTAGTATAGTLGLTGSASTEEYKIMVNYNGQADLLLSLQIPPDYYPYQFKKTQLYDYLTHVDKYIVANDRVSENKKKIKQQLQSKINQLMSHIKEFGPSLWNEDLYDTGIVFRNNQFWKNKKTILLFLEQFIADDYTDITESYDLLPSHKKLIITNYRAARDPYSIFSQKIFECFKSNNCENGQDEQEKKIYEKFKTYMDKYDREDANSLYRFGKFIKFWNDLKDKNKDQLQKLGFDSLLKEKKLFSLDDNEDKKMAEKYQSTVFSEEELCILDKWAQGEEGNNCHGSQSHTPTNWKMKYLKNSAPNIRLAHHPALEQQVIPGTAPLAEGSQKDIIVFLYQFAASIQNFTSESDFNTHFKGDYRENAMKNALNNAGLIAKNLNERIKNIREYFKEIKVVDQSFDPDNNNYTTTNSKTFTVLTYPPTSFGAGDSTIQSMSKFPWLYQDIGLKQPIPQGLTTASEDTAFSVDDNGWWWHIGSAALNPTNLMKFQGTTDTLLLLANEEDWRLLKDETSRTLLAASTLLKNSAKNNNAQFVPDIKKVQGNEKGLVHNKQYPISYNKYHLWNEGLRSPIALNLLLDNLVDIFQRQYETSPQVANGSEQSKYSKAMDWGDYWHQHFLSGTHHTSPN